MNREETILLIRKMESQLEVMRAFVNGKRIGYRLKGASSPYRSTSCPSLDVPEYEYVVLPDPIICFGHVNEYDRLIGSASCGPHHDSPQAQRQHMNEAHGKESASKMRVVRFVQDMDFVDPTASDDCGF